MKKKTVLSVEQVSVSFGSYPILEDVSFHVEEGQWLMVVGPNGAGKSTIVKCLSRENDYTGRITFQGRDIQKMKTQELAHRIGILEQNHTPGYSFSVEEVVRLGRYSYAPGIFKQKPENNEIKIEQAMELTGLLSIRNQSILTLSGGELQRTFLAQLLAQDPDVLILDEPTNHLDLIYQKQIFGLIQDWLAHTGMAVVSVVHDLSLARAYGTHAVLLDHGKKVAEGSCREALSDQNLERTYHMDVREWMHTLLSQWDRNGTAVVKEKQKMNTEN